MTFLFLPQEFVDFLPLLISLKLFWIAVVKLLVFLAWLLIIAMWDGELVSWRLVATFEEDAEFSKAVMNCSLSGFLVSRSSCSYFYKRVFCGPTYVSVEFLYLAEAIRFPLLPPLFAGTDALIWSMTACRGNKRSITAKKPSNLALCPGRVYNCSTRSSRPCPVNRASLKTSLP